MTALVRHREIDNREIDGAVHGVVGFRSYDVISKVKARKLFQILHGWVYVYMEEVTYPDFSIA